MNVKEDERQRAMKRKKNPTTIVSVNAVATPNGSDISEPIESIEDLFAHCTSRPCVMAIRVIERDKSGAPIKGQLVAKAATVSELVQEVGIPDESLYFVTLL